LYEYEEGIMKLESKSFLNEEMIPRLYTCDDQNRSPHLVWSEVPEGTKSFAISVIDPDAPGRDFIHWLIINIPREVREIVEGEVPEGAEQIVNDFGIEEYGGPCPPSGIHRYFFTIYALDTEKLSSVKKGNFLDNANRHKIASAQLMGKYSRA